MVFRLFKPKVIFLCWSRVIALLAFINLILVFFDLSYIPGRDIYYRVVYQGKHIITELYDPLKGISPYRETQNYINVIEQLKQQVAQEGLVSAKSRDLLQEIRNLSVEMIETNPFQLADKTGVLERIKNRMRERLAMDSAKGAFQTFWSYPYLLNQGWIKEIGFYDEKIKPLMELNYFRAIGETGDFVDNFWQIDVPFQLILAADLLMRTWMISRRYASINWWESLFWRWYDLLFFLPFWRWVRVIPVAVRLHQARLINLHTIQKQASQGLVATIAEDVTEVVVVRVINQMQDFVRKGSLTSLLARSYSQKYIDINNVNELKAISKILIEVTANQLVPKSQQEFEGILQYTIEKVIRESGVYQGIKSMPGMHRLEQELSKRLAHDLFQTFHQTMTNMVKEDYLFDEHLDRLLTKMSQIITSETESKKSLEMIENLLADLLEEIKINYVQRLSEQDIENILEQTRVLRQRAQNLS